MKVSQGQRAITAWVLTANILLYPLLTYLAAPTVMADSDGHWTLICTLNGLEAVNLENEKLRDGQPQNEDFCPALELFQLAGAAYHGTPLPSPTTTLYSLGTVVQAGVYRYHSAHFPIYASRAPPIIERLSGCRLAASA